MSILSYLNKNIVIECLLFDNGCSTNRNNMSCFIFFLLFCCIEILEIKCVILFFISILDAYLHVRSNSISNRMCECASMRMCDYVCVCVFVLSVNIE